MANRLKMVLKELLYALFALNWSTRKINKALCIHRATITRYRKEWKKASTSNSSATDSSPNRSESPKAAGRRFQNVPSTENKLPTGGGGWYILKCPLTIFSKTTPVPQATSKMVSLSFISANFKTCFAALLSVSQLQKS